MSDKLDLIETIKKEDKWSTFARVMESSGAFSAIAGGGEFTVFAPTNDAFGKVADATIDELLNEPNQIKLKAILTNHIVAGKLMAANLPSSPTRTSVAGDELTFGDTNGLRVNGATIQARNIEAKNGVIHQVDAVLIPTPKRSIAAAGASEAAKTVSAAPVTAPLDTPAAAATEPKKPTTIL